MANFLNSLMSGAAGLLDTVKKNAATSKQVLPTDVAAGKTGIVTRPVAGGGLSYPGEVFIDKPAQGTDFAAMTGNNPTMNNTPGNQNILGMSDLYKTTTNNNTSNTTNNSSNSTTYTGERDDQGNPIQTSDPYKSTSSSGLEDTQARIQKSIDAMRAKIIARQQELEQTARTGSAQNQSTIRGNLGRVFGANSDTSEASPVVTENNRLTTSLGQIGRQASQDLADADISGLNALEKALNDEKVAQNTARQTAFENAIAEAGLTGLYNGKETVAGQSAKLKQAMDEAGLTGMYNGGLTQDAIKKLAEITGYFGGEPTLDRTKANLTNEQKMLNDKLDFLASTTNNQNTNATKITTTNLNNASDVAQLQDRIRSNELIANNANSSREAIAAASNENKILTTNLNNQARVSLLQKRIDSGTATPGDKEEIALYKAIGALQNTIADNAAPTYHTDSFGRSVLNEPKDNTGLQATLESLQAMLDKKKT